MKKRKLLWLIPCVLLILLAAFAIDTFTFNVWLGPTLTGRYLAADGAHIIVLADGSPIVIHTGSGNEDWFQNLQTGDRIRIRYSGVMLLSWPGQITARGYKLIRSGSPADIPQETYNTLVDMGWIPHP